MAFRVAFAAPDPARHRHAARIPNLTKKQLIAVSFPGFANCSWLMRFCRNPLGARKERARICELLISGLLLGVRKGWCCFGAPSL